jgi:hypothetical protein
MMDVDLKTPPEKSCLIDRIVDSGKPNATPDEARSLIGRFASPLRDPAYRKGDKDIFGENRDRHTSQINKVDGHFVNIHNSIIYRYL